MNRMDHYVGLRVLKHRLKVSAKELKEAAAKEGIFAGQLKDELVAKLPEDKLQMMSFDTGHDWVDVPTEYVAMTMDQIKGR